MMLKKRQCYGFNGFNVPFIPRAQRSSRRGKKAEVGQICAFELLASLAGKLLQESESSASSNASESYQLAVGSDVIKHEQYGDKPLKTECLDNGSYEGSVIISEFPSPERDQKFLVKQTMHGEGDSILEHSSVITDTIGSEKVNGDVKSVLHKSKTTCEKAPGKVEEGSPDFGVSCDDCVENSFCRLNGANGLATGRLSINNTCGSKDPMKLCTMVVPASINSGSYDNKLPSHRDTISNASILRFRNGVKLGIRDVDEKFSRFNKAVVKPKAIRAPSQIGDRRIRKLLTSKCWKVAPKLKNCELSKVASLDGGMKSLYRKRKVCYNHSINKRRKFSDRSLVVTSDGGLSSESVCNSPKRGMSDKNDSATLFDGANGSSVMGHRASFQSTDSNVKFSIKSFRIPEILLEVPETATVGSLKRIVMEAVTTILGGGLRVGVLLHGKQVWDDNRTLLQTGITSEENLDTLGFMLESNLVQAPPSVCTEDPPALLPCDTSQPIPKSPATPACDTAIIDASADIPPLTSTGYNINHEAVSSDTDILTDKSVSDSKALVPVPPVSAVALAVVPVDQKSKRSDPVQRRTRRPFSVSEVEALVRAVEELGTGRWRDVKLRSFENADHRTYVDLKDKWKTLVHTAKIAPQQRRGEPVPQDLLDRVLAAHAYWSQHQAKHHGKNQASVLRIAEAPSPPCKGPLDMM